ncbi:MAG: hypothetical protein ACTSWW_11455, partial [Promethearchaeota archaeon]
MNVPKDHVQYNAGGGTALIKIPTNTHSIILDKLGHRFLDLPVRPLLRARGSEDIFHFLGAEFY